MHTVDSLATNLQKHCERIQHNPADLGKLYRYIHHSDTLDLTRKNRKASKRSRLQGSEPMRSVLPRPRSALRKFKFLRSYVIDRRINPCCWQTVRTRVGYSRSDCIVRNVNDPANQVNTLLLSSYLNTRDIFHD